MAVLASVPSAIDAPTAQRLRDNGIPVLEGVRSGLAALGHLARWPLSVDRAGCRDGSAGERGGIRRRRAGGGVRAAGRLRRFRWCASGPPTRSASAARGRRCGRLSGRAENAWCPAQERRRRRGARPAPTTPRCASAYAAMAAALGPAVTRASRWSQPGVEVSVGFVRDDGIRAAAGGRRRRHPGGIARRPGGGVPARVARGRAGDCSTACASPRCWPAGAVQPAVDIDALAEVIVAFSQMAVELGDVLDAVEANPVIASPRGVVAVDALVQASRAES